MISTHTKSMTHILWFSPSKMDLPILEFIYFALFPTHTHMSSVVLGHQRWMQILSLWAWKRWRCEFFGAAGIGSQINWTFHALQSNVNTLQENLQKYRFQYVSQHFWVDDFHFFFQMGYVKIPWEGYWEIYMNLPSNLSKIWVAFYHWKDDESSSKRTALKSLRISH